VARRRHPATGHRVTPTAAHRCTVTFTIPSWAPFYIPFAASRSAAFATSPTGIARESVAGRLNYRAFAGSLLPRTCTMPAASRKTAGQNVTSHNTSPIGNATANGGTTIASKR